MKNNVFCRELANTRPTKELKAFFALAESLPTSATLYGIHKSNENRGNNSDNPSGAGRWKWFIYWWKTSVYRKNDCQGKIKERGFLIMSFISASISIFVFCKISWKRFEIHLREKEKAGHVSCLQTFTLIACWSRNWECPPRTWHRNQLLTNIRHIFDQNLNISSPGIFPGHLSVCRCSSPTQPSNQIWRWWYLLRA